MQRNRPLQLTLAVAAILASASLLDAADPPAASLSADGSQQQFVFAYRLFQKSEDKLAAEAFDEFLAKFPGDPKKGDAIYYRAFAARRLGDNELAAKMLNDVPAPTLVPPQAIAILRGQVYIDLGQYDKALATLEALKVDNLDASTRASAYYLQGIAYQSLGNLDGATRAFTAAGELGSPLQARSLLELGKVRTAANDPAKAIDALNRSLAIGDKETGPTAARLAGDLLYQTGDYAKAIEAYNKVLANDQSSDQYAPAALGVLWSHLAAAQNDQLQAKAAQFLQILTGADALKVQHLVGLSFQNAGADDKAIATFTTILQSPEANDWRDRTTYGLALSQYSTGKLDLMATTLLGFNEKFPKSSMLTEVQFLIAAAEAKQGKAGAASARLTDLVNRGKSDPAYFEALIRRARLNESNGQLPAAAKDYREYLDAAAIAKPAAWGVADAGVRLIDIQFALNQPDGAMKTARELLATTQGAKDNPTVEPEVMFRLALAQIKVDKLDDSVATLGAMVTKYPQAARTPEARYQRGLIYMAQDKPDSALPDLKAASVSASLPDAIRADALRMSGVRLRELSAMDDAAETLTALDKLGPLKPDEIVWLIHYQLDHNQARSAIEFAKRLFTANPQTPDDIENDAEGRHLGALAFSQLGDNESALKALRQVLASKASPALKLAGQLDLARTLRLMGKTDEALKEYNQLVGAEPSLIASAALFESAQIYRNLAEQRKQAGDNASAKLSFEEARKLFKRIVLLYPFSRLSPIPELSYIELYEISVSMNQKKQAGVELKELIEKFPNGPFAEYAKAIQAASDRKTADALFILKKLPQTGDPRLLKRVNELVRELEKTQ